MNKEDGDGLKMGTDCTVLTGSVLQKLWTDSKSRSEKMTLNKIRVC